MPKAVRARPALDPREPLCGLPICALVDETSTLKSSGLRWPCEASGKLRRAVALLSPHNITCRKTEHSAELKGQRFRGGIPMGKWETTAFVVELHRKRYGRADGSRQTQGAPFKSL